MSEPSRTQSESHAYRCPGGFFIGDDVEVGGDDLHPEFSAKGRVQGSVGPFVDVMLDTGHRYRAFPEQLTRIER